MLKAPVGQDEEGRLAALRRYQILDTPDEAAFDELTRLAAAICQAPVAMVSLVDEDRQWFKSCVGLDVRSTPRDVSFCGHAIHSDHILEISNASLDPRFADNPFVTAAPHVLFYAGAPLIAGGGERLGTLCVIDFTAKTLTAEQRQALETLARQVVRLMEARQRSLASDQAAARSAATSKFLDRVLDSLPNLVAVVDHALTYQYVNAAYQTWFGLPPTHMLGRSILEVLGQKAFEAVRPFALRALRGEDVRFETEAPYRLGGTKIISLHYQPLLAASGQVEGFLAIVNDVTQLRASEGAARAVTERLRNTYENTPVGLIELSRDLRLTAVNPSFCEMLEYTAEELVGRSILQFTHPDDVAKSHTFSAAAASAVAAAAPRTEKRYVTKSGAVVWSAVTTRLADSGAAKSFYSCIENISAMKAAESATKEVTDTLRHMADAAPIFLGYLNCDLSYKFTNSNYKRFFGERLLPIQHGNLTEFFGAREAGRIAAARSIALSGRYSTVSVTCPGPGGDQATLEVRYVPHLADTGEVLGLVAVTENITERLSAQTKIEEQNVALASSAKMVALGEMAAGLAHEINNPLAIIVGKANQTTRLLAGGMPLDRTKVAANLAVIESTGQRIAKIISGLRTFSRDSSHDEKEPAAIRALVADALSLCQERFHSHGVELRWLGKSDAAVACRPAQIVQILMNLLSNAFDAVVGTASPWVELAVQSTLGEIALSVGDSGNGIADAVVEKMMQPFFTTKPVGKGTGLGLSLSLGIAREHGGDLYYDRGSGHTRFILRLPTLPAKAEGEVA